MTPPHRAKARPIPPSPAPIRVPTIPTGNVPPPSPGTPCDAWGKSEYLAAPAPSTQVLRRGTEPAADGPSHTFKPTSKPKEAREDSMASFSARLNRTIKPLYERALESQPNFQFSARLFVRINLETGEVASVTFSELKTPGTSEPRLQGFLKDVANQLRAKFRFKRGALQNGVDFIPVRVRFATS